MTTLARRKDAGFAWEHEEGLNDAKEDMAA